jgi:hypothetical protein
MSPTTELFDQRVADWLEDDPNVAPSLVLDTVLAALPSVGQRRAPMPWAGVRWLPASRFGRAGALVAAVLLLILGLLSVSIIGSPRPTPTPVATSPWGLSGQLATFTSPRYAYSMDHPVEWTVRKATESLVEGSAPWIDGAGVDYTSSNPATDVTTTPGVIVGATHLTAGRTLESWTELVAVATCGTPAARGTMTIDGESGALLEYAACFGLHHLWATVIHDGIGYHIVWIGPTTTEVQDRALFETIAATFRFPATPPLLDGSPAAVPIGEPLLDVYLGVWYDAAPAWMWVDRHGDPACTSLGLTDLDCLLVQAQGEGLRAGSVTTHGNELTVQWVRGTCAGAASRYIVTFLGSDAVTLAERPGDCETGSFTLTRAGTGTAPSAPPPPTP